MPNVNCTECNYDQLVDGFVPDSGYCRTCQEDVEIDFDPELDLDDYECPECGDILELNCPVCENPYLEEA